MKITPRKYAQALALMLDSAEKTIIGNFLEVLRRRNRLKWLPKIMKAFEEEWLKRRGFSRIEIQYPPKFESSVQGLEHSLRQKFGDKLKIQTSAENDIIGGLRVKVDDTLIDASVETGLKRLAARLIK